MYINQFGCCKGQVNETLSKLINIHIHIRFTLFIQHIYYSINNNINQAVILNCCHSGVCFSSFNFNLPNLKPSKTSYIKSKKSLALGWLLLLHISYIPLAEYKIVSLSFPSTVRIFRTVENLSNLSL